MITQTKFIEISIQNQIAVLQMNRPKVNAINLELTRELSHTLDLMIADKKVGGVILTGLPGVFSGGLDVIELYLKDRKYMTQFWNEFIGLLHKLITYPKLIFTAISGHSPAGGAVLAIMTDYRIMSKGDFKIGLNEVAVGLVLPNSIAQVFQYLIGTRQAEKLAMTGTLITPDEALQIGLVDEIVEPNELLIKTKSKIKEWRQLPATQQIATKFQLRQNLIQSIESEMKSDVEKMTNAWFEKNFRNIMADVIDGLSMKN